MSWLGLFFVGTFTGLLAGIFGLGGGFLLIPLLSFWGIPVAEAAGTSLIAVWFSAIAGSALNWFKDTFDIGKSFQIALLGIPAAQLGVVVSDLFPDRLLKLIFAVLLLAMIYFMNLQQQLGTPAQDLQLEPTPAPLPAGVSGQKFYWWQYASIGAVSGFMSGVFGIGGGLIMVPLQLGFLAETLESAVANSLGAMVAIAASGLFGHAWRGEVLWIPGLCLGAGSLFGAPLGSYILPLLNSNFVTTAFRLLLLVLSLYMVRVSWVGGLG
ncbi:MAG TPA: sulfite exporter TauE/SafE family protein [Oscillatoriaceae cyanobacterium M33_DOE_052]|nr:sulfite exporter TauE/SafE family protein [Oscillatoriaceae cyanobacterium M33_DOE_052]